MKAISTDYMSSSIDLGGSATDHEPVFLSMKAVSNKTILCIRTLHKCDLNFNNGLAYAKNTAVDWSPHIATMAILHTIVVNINWFTAMRRYKHQSYGILKL